MRILIGTLALAATVTASSANDLGTKLTDLLAAQSPTLFGIAAPLAASAPSTGPGYRKAPTPRPIWSVSRRTDRPHRHAQRRQHRGSAHALSGRATDPSDRLHRGRPLRDRQDAERSNKLNPSVQRINIATGQVDTILRGMHRCDGVRVTPWNTVVANEETVDGHIYEILNPLTTTEVTVDDRATGAVSAPELVAQRAALP